MAMARGGARALTCVGVLPLAEERTYRARDAMRFRRAVERPSEADAPQPTSARPTRTRGSRGFLLPLFFSRVVMPAGSVAKLLEGGSRFDVAILPQLEADVDAQCKGESYDLEVCLAVLKLYQFHPDQLKPPMVAKILIKALMNLPSTDFLTCTYLVPERVLDAAPVSSVCTVANLLESCKFREFWGALEPLRAELLPSTPGFDKAVRAYILSTFEITYQSVPKAHLVASLGLKGDSELAPLVSGKGWTLEGDSVKVTLNASNQPRPKQVDAAEAMSFPAMTKVLQAVNAAS